MAGDSDKLAPRATVDEEMVRSLARLLDETRLTEIEIEQGGLRVRVARQAASAPVAFATSESAEETAPSRVSMRPTASISPAMWLTAVSTTARDWVISPPAADVADCTERDAPAIL